MNKATLDLQHINLEGNIIPHKWFNSLKMDNGSPDYQAIILLSEIVYWYKPTVKFDEKGIYKGIKKKYQDDVLQKSYDDLSEKFGMTKRQVRDAIVRLENKGIIKREFRNLVIKGLAINNVLYIHLFVDKLKEISLDFTETDMGVTNSIQLECSNSSEGVPNQGYTYTDITTDITTNIKHNNKTLVHQYELDELFEQFWTVYPRKQVKKTSKDKFKLALKKYDFETIMKGTYKYAELCRIKNTSQEYIAQCTTFLNQERYLDDYDLLINDLLNNKNTNKNNNRYNPYGALESEIEAYKREVLNNDDRRTTIAIPENFDTLF